MPSRNPPSSDEPGDFGEDEEATTVDGAFVSEGDIVTPVEVRRCADCGSVIFDDGYDEPAASFAMNLFTAKQCMRAHDGHWSVCANYSKTHKKIVILVPH